MNIVVTGSLGHISKPLTQELVQKGHSVTVISSKASRQKEIEAIGAKPATGSMENAAFLAATWAWRKVTSSPWNISRAIRCAPGHCLSGTKVISCCWTISPIRMFFWSHTGRPPSIRWRTATASLPTSLLLLSSRRIQKGPGWGKYISFAPGITSRS